MGIRAIAALIGRPAEWHFHGLTVSVEILDARESFGRVDLLIRPVGGSGEKWADKESVSVGGGEA